MADTIDSVTITIQAISAAINIDPDTLNLRSNGRWITAYIELPGHYSAEDINLEAIRLQYEGESLAAEWGDLQDGVLMVKFNRAAITGWFDGLHDIEVSLTLTGEVNGFQFEGSDTIRVINPPVREQSQSSNFGPPDDIPGNNANNVTGPPEKDMPDRGNSSNAIPDHANGRR